MSLTNRQWQFTDDVTVNINIGTPAITQQITILNKVTVATPLFHTVLEKWYINEADFLLIQANQEYLFIEDEGTGVFTNYFLGFIVNAAPITQDDDGYYIFELYLDTGSATFLTGSNLVWILAPSVSETITDITYLSERWRRYEHTEEIRYIDSLARVYHDTVKDGAYKISGTVQGFINPLELATFTFITGRKFVVANSTISIDKAETRIDLVEAIKENVTDYVAE